MANVTGQVGFGHRGPSLIPQLESVDSSGAPVEMARQRIGLVNQRAAVAASTERLSPGQRSSAARISQQRVAQEIEQGALAGLIGAEEEVEAVA